MTKVTVLVFAILLSAHVFALRSDAQTTEITYQGQLQSSSAAANGNFDFEFALFSSAGGGGQIGSTITRNGVAVSNGIFSVNLDFGSNFPGATRFLEIRVRQSGGGAFTTLSPRQPVTSSPYSIKSLTAASADNAANATTALTATNFAGNLAGDVIGTQSTTSVIRLQTRPVASTPPLDGQVLKFSGGQWVPDTDNAGSGGGGGTITGVTAGTGLTGGGATGNVTVGIGAGGVGTGQLAEGSVVDSKIVAVSGSKVTGSVANATNAGTATNATQLGGVAANLYLQTNGNGSGLTNLNASSITTGTLANARLGQIPTANIADSAITGAKIAGGQVIKHVNGLTDNVTLAAGSNISITSSGNTLTIASTGGSSGVGGSGATSTVPLWSAAATLGNSVITQTAAGRVGIGISSPSTRLEVAGDIRAAPTSGIAVIGDSPTGTGVFGSGNTGVVGSGQNIGVDAQAPSPGRIALRTNGTSWFKGDTSPLNAAQTGTGTGIAIGSAGTLGYISAFDYSVFQPRTLLLNNSGGNVGINTNNPTSRLHVVGSSDGGVLGTATSTGNGVSGISPGGNGVSGSGAVGVIASGSTYGMQAQSTSGIGITTSASARGGIALRAQGSSWFTGDTTPLDRFNAQPGTGIVIGSAGNLGYISAYDYWDNQTRTLLLNNGGGLVGIGTNSPAHTLTVNGTAGKPGGGSWSTFSDDRLKNIKGRFNGGLKAVMKLQPLRYEYKQDNMAGVKSDGEHIGFSAQEVEKIIPEAVTKTEQGIRLVNNDPIILAMLNAIKEQQAAIEKLTARVRQLQRANARINRIKSIK